MDHIRLGDPGARISPTLFGLFLEDINFACDGGLNANMVANYSFGGIYPKKPYNMILIYMTKHWNGDKPDRLRYWEISGGSIESLSGAPGKSGWYARVTSKGSCTLKNNGYNGGGDHRGECAMGIRAGETYHFSCWMRSHDLDGRVFVYLEDASGKPLTGRSEVPFSDTWQQTGTDLKAFEGAPGRLVILFEGNGSIDIDCVSLEADDVWGRGDPRWSVSHMRRDLVEALRDLHPSFMRFPGGCIVEGVTTGNQYEWKKTVGPLIDREEKFNLWASGVKDKGYTQTNQIGFYEYFLLCEDLNMEPLPIVWAGMYCQARSKISIPTASPEFQEQVVQNALDLIGFANGDPTTNEWAKVRADMGHPEPFGLKMIGIGNENYGEEYYEKFAVVKKAIDEHYPGMLCIMAAGLDPDDENHSNAWKEARERYGDSVCIDEHFYRNPEWVYTQLDRYDNYPRGTTKVFLGEYAAHGTYKGVSANSWQTAIAEAAFLTGVERNGDVVELCSYAPLLCLAERGQWTHNLIYFNPYHIMKSTNYYVQQMYMAHQGTYVRKVEGDVPENISISASETEKALIIKIANTAVTSQSIDIDCTASLGEPGIAAKTCAVSATRLTCSDLEETNELTFTGEPVYKVQPESLQLAADNAHIQLEMEPYGFYVIEIERG